MKKQKDTCAGEDTIHPRMVKMDPTETKRFMLELYNRIWREEEKPNSWKSAIVRPMLKEGKDIRSYRPVAFTSSLCKIFERMINRRLVWYLEKESNINIRQFDFRKQRNTMENNNKDSGRLQKERKNSGNFFYIEKAYDKINRENTFEQLESMEISGRTMKTIKELIKERWIKVRANGYISQRRKTELGIPQGGVLSMTLFLVGINDILKKLGNGVDESLFADDLAIYTQYN